MHDDLGNSNCVALTKQNELILINMASFRKINSVKVKTSTQIMTSISVTKENDRILATGKKNTNIIELYLNRITEGESGIKVIKTNHSDNCEFG